MKNLLLSVLALVTFNVAYSQGSGKLLDYNGSSTYVNCGTINLSGSALTLQGWIKVDNFNAVTGGSSANISSLWGSESSNTTLLRLGDGAALAKEKVQFVIGIGRQSEKLNGVTSLTTGVWYHIAGTYNGSTMKIYINGVEDASKSVSGSITTNAAFDIGRNYANTRIFDGQFDDISVFKSALSQSTIRNWMCQSIKTSHPNYNTLEAYWKFDKGTGTSVTDHSTKTHTGSFNGSPTWATSSAAIGDTSITDFVSPLNVKLTHANGDSMVISNLVGSPSSVHLYLVNKKPNATSFPSGISVFDSTRYWGVFYGGGNSSSASINYYYSSNSHYKATGSCMIDLAKREDNAKTSWTVVSASQSSSSLNKASQTRNEFILVYRSNKVIHKDAFKTICNGDSVTLKHNTSGLTYVWFKNNVQILGATSNIYQAKSNGSYNMVASLGSCSDTSFTFNLTTKQKPVVSFPPLSASCPSVLYDTIKGGFPSGGVYINTFMSGNLFVVKTAKAGNHKILYQYTDSAGCSDTASQMKLVYNYPMISLSPLPKMCADTSSFNLTNGQPMGGTYFVNDTLSNSFDVNTLGVGSHKIRYNITDTNNCKNADSITVTVVKLPSVVLSLFRKTACEYDNPIPLDGQNPTGGTFTGLGVNGFNFEPKTAGSGKHPVTYTVTDNKTGCKNHAIDSFQVNPKPSIPLVTQVVDSLKSSKADVYLWYDAKDKRQTGNGQSFKPKNNGNYYVVIKKLGCQSDKSELVNYQALGLKFASSNLDLRVFPIPAKDFLYLESSKNIKVKILDLNGRLILEKESKGNIAISVSDFENGVYILEIKTKSEIERRRRVVIQN